MKSTRLKISVSQDGLLPEETAEVATIQFPILPKKLLKALGFERVDTRTYVGVLPVFVNIGQREQEIVVELGVTIPEMRKKVIEVVKTPSKNASPPKKVLKLAKTSLRGNGRRPQKRRIKARKSRR
ncbi:MAG: hypothetical protein L0Y68_00760 [Candidatus Dadabacteria bacterium]|nr:hypothetical protein [Candidatus Dadabacteria bacterium]